MKKRRAPQPREQVNREAKAERPVVVGARVRELQEARGWSQQELAWRANLSVPKVNRIIREKAGCGSAVLLRLVLVLNTSADYLLGLTDEKRPRSG